MECYISICFLTNNLLRNLPQEKSISVFLVFLFSQDSVSFLSYLSRILGRNHCIVPEHKEAHSPPEYQNVKLLRPVRLSLGRFGTARSCHKTPHKNKNQRRFNVNETFFLFILRKGKKNVT
ncbi:hypothetical protein TWF217_006190 [Orbilia oligospora]|nr:hypothetical protein TWF128_003248 [Orbilia oligospora]KAF3256873.1 hypothetical protein TWF217_006190 [Orbilia oligospora]